MKNRMMIGVVLAAGLATTAAAVDTVSGSIVVREGDALAGSIVDSINAPFTNGNGQVGLVIGLTDGRRAIWYDNGVIFTSDQADPDVLTGGEGTMGIGNNGEFIYSPSINGSDGVWGQDGLIAVEDTQAPDFTDGFNSTFHSRPQMTDDGTSYWVAGTNDGAGGTSTQARILYQRTSDGTITGILRAGDNVDGAVVAGFSGIDFDYSISGNNANRMFGFNDATASGTTDDGRISVNGTIVASEASATGQGDNWDNFDAMSVNDNGNYLFSGDTDGDTAMDEFIAYNGVISIREGMTVDGLTLDSFVRAASINNLDQAAFIWQTAEEEETLFFASAASELESAVKLLSVGDLFDATGDGEGDYIIDDFNASTIGPGLDFAEDGLIYVEVDLIDVAGGDAFEAIISIAVPAPLSSSVLALGGLLAIRRRR